MADWMTVRHDPTWEEKLDPEVIPLCDALNAAGFVTTSSCSGHGGSWPHVWFEHSADERIEAMARFVKAREEGAFRPFFSQFQKEILLDGYAWSLTVHLNDCYSDTPPEETLRQAVFAMGEITKAIDDWKSEVDRMAA
jgi:Methyltransferase TYW3